MTSIPSAIDQQDFDAHWYLSAYPDVRLSGLNPFDFHHRYGAALGRQARARAKALRRIVFVITDISTIGGVPNRTRIVLNHTAGRHISFHAMTLKNEFGKQMENAHCLADDPDALRAHLTAWSPRDTVFLVSNNMLKPFPADIVARVERFPIVYFSAGQLAFFIQNSTMLLDLDYIDRFRAMRIVSLSDADIRFQQQLGIFGQIKGMVPVAQRASNSFDPARNRRLGYVGRIDFHAKDCMRLIDVAQAMKGTPWMPMQIFTTDGKNSPEYATFRQAVADAGLEDQFEFVVNCTDKDRIYAEIGVLLLPSKMEGFGNVVVEAFSYGIPVIAASYAPGPAETIRHGQSGFLLEAYTGAEIRRFFDAMTPERWQQLSAGAFARHKDYTLDVHVEFLERVCAEALEAFEGQNLHRVFPVLKMAEEAEKKIARAAGKGVQT